ncbi:MAG: HAD family phosphatase [Burkholderiaceae bacterium]
MNVVFDFGGVLFRWQPHEFMPRLLPRLAFDDASTRALVLAFFQHFEGDWGEFDLGRIDAGTLAGRITRRIGITVDEARFAIDAVVDELTPLADSVTVLRRLHARGHGLFFLSNMPLSYAALLESRNDFFGLFRSGLFSSRVGLVKPEPAIYELAIATFGVDPLETVFIDDVERNLVAASRFGWRGILFRNATQCEGELRALGVM